MPHTEINSLKHQFRQNAFALVEQPVWPHVGLTYADGRYELLGYNHDPDTGGNDTVSIPLRMMLLAEAIWRDDTRTEGWQGERLLQGVRTSNAELEQRAQWLEARAAELRREKRPELALGEAEAQPPLPVGLDADLLRDCIADALSNAGDCSPQEMAKAAIDEYEYRQAGHRPLSELFGEGA